jgi:hypothetical protein
MHQQPVRVNQASLHQRLGGFALPVSRMNPPGCCFTVRISSAIFPLIRLVLFNATLSSVASVRWLPLLRCFHGTIQCQDLRDNEFAHAHAPLQPMTLWILFRHAENTLAGRLADAAQRSGSALACPHRPVQPIVTCSDAQPGDHRLVCFDPLGITIGHKIQSDVVLK